MSNEAEVQKFITENGFDDEEAFSNFKNFLKNKKDGQDDLKAFKIPELQKYAKEFPIFEIHRMTSTFGESQSPGLKSKANTKIISDNEEVEEELADNVGPLPGDSIRRKKSDIHQKVAQAYFREQTRMQ